jgi:hypothetical protein
MSTRTLFEHVLDMRHAALLLIVLGGCVGSQHLTPAPAFAPLFGFHAGMPATYSVAVGGAAVVSRRLDGINPRSHDDRDIFALAEPGWKAARASIGYGIERNRVRATTLMNIRASALRRWTDRPVRDYLGIEVSAVTMEELALGARVGVFKQVDGPAAPRRYLVSVDFPVGW